MLPKRRLAKFQRKLPGGHPSPLGTKPFQIHYLSDFHLTVHSSPPSTTHSMDFPGTPIA